MILTAGCCLLQDFQRRGGRIVLPPGSAAYDTVVLDQLDVTEVLRKLAAGEHGPA